MHINKKMKKIFIRGAENTLENYAEAVSSLGCIAVVSLDLSLASDCDGLLLAGGGDLNPALYNQQNTSSSWIDDQRDADEVALIKMFYEAGKPIMGICRGFQLLNVYFGGTMIQDIENHHIHTRGMDEDDKVHSIKVIKDCYLSELYGKEFNVNSSHHQALDKVADMFEVLAYSEDGIVEAIVNEEKNIYAVQFHPERMCFSNLREDTVDGSIVINYFISKC